MMKLVLVLALGLAACVQAELDLSFVGANNGECAGQPGKACKVCEAMRDVARNWMTNAEAKDGSLEVEALVASLLSTEGLPVEPKKIKDSDLYVINDQITKNNIEDDQVPYLAFKAAFEASGNWPKVEAAMQRLRGSNSEEKVRDAMGYACWRMYQMRQEVYDVLSEPAMSPKNTGVVLDKCKTTKTIETLRSICKDADDAAYFLLH